MIENELKRIADALEAIAIAMQPVHLATNTVDVPTPRSPEAGTDVVRMTTVNDEEKPVTKKAKAKAEKPVPVLDEAIEIPADDAPAGVKEYTTDEIVDAVQKAVKINRDATLAICKKYGYATTLKDIKADKYEALATELNTVK